MWKPGTASRHRAQQQPAAGAATPGQRGSTSAAAAGTGAGARDCLSRVQQSRQQEQSTRPTKRPQSASVPAHLRGTPPINNQDASHPASTERQRCSSYRRSVLTIPDELVRQALSLLEEAGRLDLLAPVVHPHACPVRRAAAGVDAAVVVCSPPHSDAGTEVGVTFRGRLCAR
ncbi:hypothetical protein NDU88_003209 [Pleurodeles waltl]|uniref:Uncharacterized protein n=1 Tax=Pleurodeles waltl TaxID=8319 RepID=A0AAV7KWV9_PLEWA|nr:hypothetical protein NDU88_003209 [Pleurodeles waltl]